MPAITVEDLTTLARIAAPDAPAVQRPVRSVTSAPRGLEGEGFPVFRAFAGVDLAALDPFVHLDQMGEVDYGPGEPKGTPWHPHRGFETVTYMMDGLLQHHDSQGGGGLISDGGTQWMTAGQGILHIETPPEHVVASGGLFHGLQLWVNLPKAQKWVAPRYQDLEPESVLLLASDDAGALVRVIAGDIGGHRGPGATHTPMTMVHASVSPGAQLVLPWPREFNALVYVLAGRGSVGAEKRPLQQAQLAVLGSGDAITVTADTTQDGRTAVMEVLLLGGRPIREPVAWGGPFVMNTNAELAQAFEDFEAGRLGKVPALTDAPTREVKEQIDSALD
jgi:redox-sensitive bicupin YhaK (pirin superfamily)